MRKYLSKVPALLLIIGGLVRVAGTGEAALWYDESNTLYRTTIPFLTLYSQRTEAAGDLLLEIILRPLMVLSHSVWMLRLPSMLAGLVSLWLVWKLMQRLEFTLSQQICTTTLVAFMPGLLWMAQDARSYGLLACLFLAALWFALESRWLGLLAVCGLMIYAHNTGPVCAVAALTVAIYLYPWKTKKILLVVLGIVVAWIPAAVHMFVGLSTQQPWQAHLTSAWLLSSTITALWPVFFNGWFYLLALIALNSSMFLLLSKVRAHGRIVPLLAWLISGAGLIAFSLITGNNVVLYRTLMPMLFPFCLWLGWELGRERVFSKAMSIAWTGLLIWGMAFWHPSDRGGHLDQIASEIRSQWRTGDVIVYTTYTVGLPFDYYLHDLPHTYNDTIREPFLYYSGYATALTSPIGDPTRYWVIVPEDALITPGERATLTDLTHHQEPLYTIRYIQTASINVYLVEAAWK